MDILYFPNVIFGILGDNFSIFMDHFEKPLRFNMLNAVYFLSFEKICCEFLNVKSVR